MNQITTEALITNDHKLSLSLELPRECPTGLATVTITVEPRQETPQNASMADLYGKYEGQIWTSDDFDEPLDDFADYM